MPSLREAFQGESPSQNNSETNRALPGIEEIIVLFDLEQVRLSVDDSVDITNENKENYQTVLYFYYGDDSENIQIITIKKLNRIKGIVYGIDASDFYDEYFETNTSKDSQLKPFEIYKMHNPVLSMVEKADLEE